MERRSRDDFVFSLFRVKVSFAGKTVHLSYERKKQIVLSGAFAAVGFVMGWQFGIWHGIDSTR